MSLSWPAPTPHSSAAAQDSLQQAMTMIGVASGLAASGRKVDLTGLESIAGTLCAQVLDLPPADGAALRPAMLDLYEKLTTLADVIRRFEK